MGERLEKEMFLDIWLGGILKVKGEILEGWYFSLGFVFLKICCRRGGIG